MKVSRLFSHLLTTKLTLASAFPQKTLSKIEAAIKASEALHTGQLRFAVELALDPWSVLKAHTPRDRALEVFSNLRVWDTEQNCGLLIYVLLADRAVEIVADRGIDARVGEAQWALICRQIETDFKQRQFESGVLEGITAMTGHLARHFPRKKHHTENELPDQPVVLE